MNESVDDVIVTSSTSLRPNDTKLLYRNLMCQFPPHDFDPRHCSWIRGDSENKTMDEFVETRIKSSLGQGLSRIWTEEDPIDVSCYQCQGRILHGQLTVTAGSSGSSRVWHADCFICVQCRQHLVERVYFWSRDGIYCGRHHAETLRPRCAYCDEIIFSDECTEANGRFWHLDHFRCHECRIRLAGGRYVVTSGRSYCQRCYTALLADVCRSCGRVIQIGERHIVLPDAAGTLHADGPCFQCASCRRSLVGRPFIVRRTVMTSSTQRGNELVCGDTEQCRVSSFCYKYHADKRIEDSHYNLFTHTNLTSMKYSSSECTENSKISKAKSMSMLPVVPARLLSSVTNRKQSVDCNENETRAKIAHVKLKQREDNNCRTRQRSDVPPITDSLNDIVSSNSPYQGIRV